MQETLQPTGLFDVFEHTLTSEQLRDLLGFCAVEGKVMRAVLEHDRRFSNIIMSNWKALAAAAVFSNVASLVITTQNSTPADSETGYTGAIYTTVAADEVLRSDTGLPYQVGWNIASNLANGTWGSFVLIDSNGTMINRALAGVTKNANTSKLVIFTGDVA